MPKHDDSPFAAYLRRVDTLLADLPSARRAAIRRELAAHLEDAAAEQNRSQEDPLFQETVIAQLGPSDQVALAFAEVYGGLSLRLRTFAAFAGTLGGLLGMLGALAYLGRNTIGIVLACGLMLAGAAGMLGAAWLRSDRRGAMPLVWSSGIALLLAGFPVFYHQQHDLDTMLGLWLLCGGEFLLMSGAIAAHGARFPRLNKRTLAGLVLLLVSFVSPFSYLPNPLGLYYFFFGVYRFDPNLPFVNHFATKGVENSSLVGQKLDHLIGQTGLDPLDPIQPLAGYRILSETATSMLVHASVDVELRYADGTTRRSTITMLSYDPRVTYTSIDTLFAPHLELPGLPFAGADAPLQFTDLERLPIGAVAYQGHMAAWSPDGRRVLYFAEKLEDRETTLWAATPATGETQRIALGARSPLWTADGKSIIYIEPGESSPDTVQDWPVDNYMKRQGWSAAIQPRNKILMHNVDDGGDRLVGRTDRRSIALAGDNVYFLSNNVLWRVALSGGPAEQLRTLPSTDQNTDDQSPILVDPAGQHIAYRCDDDVCVAATSGGPVVRVALGFRQPYVEVSPPAANVTPGPIPTSLPAELSPPQFGALGLAWSPDGRRLAAIVGAWDYGTLQIPPVLRIITPEGKVEQQMDVGPNGLTEAPQWLPDGRSLLINIGPEHGRRMVVVDLPAERVLDLSRPRWDALVRLSPDGSRALIWNGRGGLWIARVTSH